MIYSIYEKATGIIVQTMSVVKESDIVVTDDFGYVEGSYKPREYKYEDGEVNAYVPSYVSGYNSKQIREVRNQILKDTDWTQVPDSPLTDSKKTEWATYRQALRNMMASYTDNEDNTLEATTFPTEPS